MTQKLKQLHTIISTHYSLSELQQLCFDLNVEFENLPGPNTRIAKVRELILILGRQYQFEELFDQIEKERPALFPHSTLRSELGPVRELYTQLEEYAANTQPAEQKLLQRILTMQNIGFLALIIVTIAAAYFLYSTLRTETPDQMTGDFRIAVAEFLVTGDESSTELGNEIAIGMHDRLVSEIEQFNLDVIVTTWGPVEVGTAGMITGSNAEERAASAEQLAKQIDANILVYGVIDTTSTSWSVQPEFYISEENFYEAQEIIGHHKIGDAFSVVSPTDTGKRFIFSDEITPRVNLLSHITVGLVYYAIENYPKSLEALLLAEDIEGLEEDDGLQVLYLLTGNAAGKSGELDIAESYNLRALEIDPEYARAQIGLASVMYIRALASEPINSELLNDSVQQYLNALVAETQPNLADISTKGHFGLGQSYMVLTLIGESNSFEPAISEFEQVISDYGEGTNSRIRVLAGEAHGRLGRIYAEMGLNDLALSEYEASVELLKNISSRWEVFEQRAAELRAE